MKKLLFALFLVALAGDAAFVIQNFWPETAAAGWIGKAVGLAKSATAVDTPAGPSVTEGAPESAGEAPPAKAPEAVPDERPAESPVAGKEPEGPWKGLEPENWYSGPKVAERDFRGKAVLVYGFSAKERDSVEMLPRVQDLCLAYRGKGLLVIASHRGGKNPKVGDVARKMKLKIPVYEGAGRTKEPAGGAFPFVYVVDDAGRVYNCGQDVNSAIEKFVSEIWPRLGKGR